MPYVIPNPTAVFRDGIVAEPSEIKRTYLMAQFLQRPNEYFEFDHVRWEVVFIFLKNMVGFAVRNG